jgi:hypothetical protein
MIMADGNNLMEETRLSDIGTNLLQKAAFAVFLLGV